MRCSRLDIGSFYRCTVSKWSCKNCMNCSALPVTISFFCKIVTCSFHVKRNRSFVSYTKSRSGYGTVCWSAIFIPSCVNWTRTGGGDSKPFKSFAAARSKRLVRCLLALLFHRANAPIKTPKIPVAKGTANSRGSISPGTSKNTPMMMSKMPYILYRKRRFFKTGSGTFPELNQSVIFHSFGYFSLEIDSVLFLSAQLTC